MPQLANRVQEVTTTGGTGTLTLAGAVTGYQTFASSFSTSDVLFYTIDNGIGEWEIGIGTLLTTGTLSRDTVIASSNGGALVNFSSGTKRVFCSAPTRALVPDQDGKTGFVLTTDGTNPLWVQTLNGVTIGNLTAAGGAFTTLSASSTVSGAGFSNYLASPPAIGGTAPAAGAFTTLSSSSTTTLNGTSIPASKTLATLTDTQTLTNKTLTNPTINGFTGSTAVVNIGSGQVYKDASGNVGLGTSSPLVRLHLKAGTNNAVVFALENTNGGTNEKIWDWACNSTALTLRLINDVYGAAYAAYEVQRSGFSAVNHSWLVGSGTLKATLDSTNFRLYQLNSSSNTSVLFDTTTQNALTLTGDGNLLVGTTSPSVGSQFNRVNIEQTNGGYYALGISNSAAGTMYLLNFGQGATNRGYIWWDNSAGILKFTGQASATYSDKRLKEVKAEAEYGLADILKIETKRFIWKRNGKSDIGVIAQDLHEIIPEAVEVGSDGYLDPMEFNGDDVWKVREEKLVIPLIKAIKELYAEIEQLKSRIN